HPGERDGAGRWPLWTGVGRGLRLGSPAGFARPPQPSDETRDRPGRLAIAQGPDLPPELHAVRAPLPPALEHIRHVGPQDLAGPLGAAGTRGPGRPSNTEAATRPNSERCGGELFPFFILHWQYEPKMGENWPVGAQKLGKVAGSSGNRK